MHVESVSDGERFRHQASGEKIRKGPRRESRQVDWHCLADKPVAELSPESFAELGSEM